MAKQRYASGTTQQTDPEVQTEQTEQLETSGEQTSEQPEGTEAGEGAEGADGVATDVEGAADQEEPTEPASTETAAETTEEQPVQTNEVLGNGSDGTNTPPEQIAPQVGDTVVPGATDAPTETQPTEPAADTEQAAAPTPAAEELQPVVLSETAAARFETEPAQVSALKQELQRYIGDLAPGRRIDPNDGGGRQALLANLLVDTITQPDVQVFLGMMATWLETIRQHRKGVFNERYVFRFAANIPLAKPKQQQWQHLMTVLLNIADGNKINQIVDLEMALRSLPDTFAARLRQYAERVTQ